MVAIYQRPSFAEVKRRLDADFEKMPAIIRDALAPAFAKIDHAQHGHLDWIRRQISPLECDEEMLHVWAALYNVPRLAASFAQGAALAKGNPATQLLIDTALRGQNGLDYKVIEPVVMGSEDTPVMLRCLTAGTSGNMAFGQELTLIDPVPGIDNTLTVGAEGIQGGAEEETVDAWRLRVVDEWRMVTTEGARGGRVNDYRYWAKAAHPSVTGALVFPNALGPGTVLAYPVCNGLPDRLPTQAIIDAVQVYLMGTPPRYSGKAPAGANVSVAMPITKPVQMSLTLNADYDTVANRDAIYSACYAALLKENQEDSVLLMAELDAAISSVTSQYVRHEPLANIAVGMGEILTLAEIEWIPA